MYFNILKIRMHPLGEDTHAERTGPCHQPVVDDALFPVFKAPAAVEICLVLASHRTEEIVDLQFAVADELHDRSLHHLAPGLPSHVPGQLCQLVQIGHHQSAVGVKVMVLCGYGGQTLEAYPVLHLVGIGCVYGIVVVHPGREVVRRLFRAGQVVFLPGQLIQQNAADDEGS